MKQTIKKLAVVIGCAAAMVFIADQTFKSAKVDRLSKQQLGAAKAQLAQAQRHFADLLEPEAEAQPRAGFGLLTPPKLVNSASNWTNSLVGSVAYTNVIKIDCSGSKDVAFAFTAAAVSSSVTTNIWYLMQSVDGSSPTNALGVGGLAVGANVAPFATILQIMNGTTPVTVVTNFTASQKGATPFLYIWAVTNGGTVTVTNYSVSVSQL